MTSFDVFLLVFCAPFVLVLFVFIFRGSLNGRDRSKHTKSIPTKKPSSKTLSIPVHSTSVPRVNRKKPLKSESQQKRIAKTDKLEDRDELKKACLAHLSMIALEHPAGHGKNFARYFMISETGDRIEILLEKAEKGRPYLWLSLKHASPSLKLGIEFREYQACDLYQPVADGGKPVYGRHSALKLMRDLANSDLVRFKINRIDQIEAITSNLRAGPAEGFQPRPTP